MESKVRQKVGDSGTYAEFCIHLKDYGMKKLFPIFCLGLWLCASVLYGKGAVSGDLRWVGPRPAMDRPVSLGIPFLEGELKKDGMVCLEADGSCLPSDCWPLAYWPDGSVKWMGVAAVIPSAAETIRFETVGKKRKADEFSPAWLNVDETSDSYVLSTGRLKAYVPKQGTRLLDSLCLHGRKVGGAARLLCSTQDRPSAEGADALHFTDYEGRVERAAVERAGAMHAVVRLDGHYADGEGRSWLPFTVRLYFYAGSEEVKMVHTFVFDGDMEHDFIRSLGVRFEVPMREVAYNRHVAFATAEGGVWAEPVQPLVGRRVLTLDGKTDWQARQMRGERIPPYERFDAKNRGLMDHWAAWDGFRLSQTTPDAFTVRKRTHADRPWIGTFSGTRAPGYVFAGDVGGGLGVALKDFWQSYPTGLQVDGAAGNCAELTVWLWSPDGGAMDLRHYDGVAHGLEASYEDVQEGMSTPYGVARTHTLTLVPAGAYGGKARVAQVAALLAEDAPLLCTPEYLHAKKAFGVWSLPDRTNAKRARVEDRLEDYLDYYVKAVDQHRWYGFWNYGDFMHTYDSVRHTWRYDVGGYAWDNTELASNMWLWYSFLRTGRADIWRMAVAMSRHTAECDVYHLGPYAGLGSRHNVSHWGCGAKEARISQAAWNRFYYYLTTDERSGDLMTEVKDADQKLYEIDPMRLALPRSKYPCTAPARLRVGPDWLAYAGNWMTEWERTGDKAYRDKIVAGMKSIAALPHGIFTGPGVLGFDPATGVLSYEGDPELQHTEHLTTIMGGFQVMNELMGMIDLPEWNRTWLEFARDYKEKALSITHNPFPVTRLKAYAAYKAGRADWAAEAWDELWHVWHNDKPFALRRVEAPEAPAPLDENPVVCTNDAATWSLAAIYMQEVIPE